MMCAVYPAVAFAESVQIEVDEEICQRVQRHIARQDVAYKPGVNARGEAVVPADVNDNQLTLPDRIVLDISLPLQDLYAVTSPPKRSLQNAEVQIGKLEYDVSTGTLRFNDQKMGEAALLKIGKKCFEVYEASDYPVFRR